MGKTHILASTVAVTLACLSYGTPNMPADKTEPQAGVRAQLVYPGIWRIRLGTPERLTPLGYRSAAVAKDGLANLNAAPAPAVAIDQIRFAKSARGCIVEFPMDKSEKFYGLGLSTNTFELSGRKAWVVPSDHPEETTNESHAPEPFFVSSRGYGVYLDTARYAAVSFGNVAEKEGHRKSVLVDIPGARGVDVYIFSGKSPLESVQRYNLFAGGGVVPPMWGLGIAYRGKGSATADDVLGLAKSFRDDDIPCDIFGIEPGWQTQTYSCSFLWNLGHFPKPSEFIDKMHGMDYRMSFWEHPFTHPTSPIHEALKPYSGSHLVWNGLVPDFATPQARKIFLGQQNESLFSKGVDSLKIDEVDYQPFKPDPWSFPDSSTFPSGLDGEQMHSLFGTLCQQTMLTPYREKNLRTWGLVRNSGALSASLPYTIYSDTYDHRSYIRGLAKTGFGGHLWTPEVRDAKSVDDLIRRVQTVIFSPYAMINCWYMKMPPWLQIDADKSNAGQKMAESEDTTRRVREIFRLRMSLAPYLYSAFNEYRQTGLPVVRALCLDYPGEADLAGVDDQFMFGPSMMVAPMMEGQKKRPVAFPKGDWYDFYTGERVKGGQVVEVAKTLDEMPLYVKAETLLPLAEPVNHIGKETVFKIHVRVYGAHPGDLSLYEDDWETYDYEKGAQTKLTLSWTSSGGASKRSGNYAKHRYEIVGWESK